MPIRVHCPSCHRALEAGDDLAGKTARCPACKSNMTVPARQLAPTAPEIPIVQVTPYPSAHYSARPSQSVAWAIVALFSIVALIAGFFAGREYLKHEQRHAIEQFGETLRDAFGPQP